jgi:hypothetical protein
MKLKVLIGIALLLSVAFSAAAAPPNLTGKYKLDTAKSEGVPAGMEQVMTIRQSGSELNIETKVYPAADSLAGVAVDLFVLNGQETPFKATRGMGIGVGKRVAKWIDDGKGIDITEESLIDMPGQGQIKINTTRKWTISPDGKEITIEQVAKDPQRETRTKRVFTRL